MICKDENKIIFQGFLLKLRITGVPSGVTHLKKLCFNEKKM